jgi:hypothetical protein
MKQLNLRFALISLAPAALCGVLAAGPAAAADSACKGLDQAKCAAAADCGWTSEYTRKDGKTVSGYCRKGSKQATPAATKDKTPAPTPAAKAPPVTAPTPATKGSGTTTAPTGTGMTAPKAPPASTGATPKPPAGPTTSTGPTPMPK